MSEANPKKKSGAGGWFLAALILFGMLVAAGVFGAYTYGEGNFYIDGRTVSELAPHEVIGGVVAAILGILVAIVAGSLGILLGIAAVILSLGLALLGVATGLLVTIGVILGPFLLLAAIVMMFRCMGRKDRDTGTGAGMTGTDASAA